MRCARHALSHRHAGLRAADEQPRLRLRYVAEFRAASRFGQTPGTVQRVVEFASAQTRDKACPSPMGAAVGCDALCASPAEAASLSQRLLEAEGRLAAEPERTARAVREALEQANAAHRAEVGELKAAVAEARGLAAGLTAAASASAAAAGAPDGGTLALRREAP